MGDHEDWKYEGAGPTRLASSSRGMALPAPLFITIPKLLCAKAGPLWPPERRKLYRRGSPIHGAGGAQARVISSLRLFLARSREPAAGREEDSYKFRVASDQWRVDSASAGSHSRPCGPKLSSGDGPLQPQRGDLTKPRLKAWVNGTRIKPRALMGRNNPFQSQTYRSS